MTEDNASDISKSWQTPDDLTVLQDFVIVISFWPLLPDTTDTKQTDDIGWRAQEERDEVGNKVCGGWGPGDVREQGRHPLFFMK